MIKTQEELCERAAQLRHEADNIHLASQEEVITTSETGSHALVKYIAQPETLLHTKWAGPFRVLGHEKSECKLLGIVTKIAKLVNSSRMKIFRFNPVERDLLNIARRDSLKIFVAALLEHRENPRKVSSIPCEMIHLWK